MAGIVDLDADRAGIEVGLSRPQALAGMPGPLLFGDELGDPSLLVDEVMTRDARLWPRQPIERAFRRLHAGVMQDEHVGLQPVAPRLAVRRGTPQRGERTVRGGGHWS